MTKNISNALRETWKTILVIFMLVMGLLVGSQLLWPSRQWIPTGQPLETTKRPISDESIGWTGVGIHYQRVDDTGSGDGDTTYIYTDPSGDAWESDFYGAEDWTEGAATIEKITIYVQCRSESSPYKFSCATLMKTPLGAVQTGVTNQPAASYSTYSTEYTTNPDDSQAWETSDIDAIQIGVKGKSGWKPKAGPYYKGRCTQVYMVITYTEGGAPTPTVELGARYGDTGDGVDFQANCTSGGNLDEANLSHYVLWHNLSETYERDTGSYGWTAFGSETNMSWAIFNTTWYRENCTNYMMWSLECNNTDGETAILMTGNTTFWLWKPLGDISERSFGQTAGGQRVYGSVYYNGTNNGPYIYTIYADSNVAQGAQWKASIRAFNVQTEDWTLNYTLFNLGGSDGHYNPSLTLTPDGRLMAIYGYYSYLTIRVGSHNLDSEDNVTKIITEWDDPAGLVGLRESQQCYPHAVYFSDTVTIFNRDGTSYGGNWTLRYWNNTQALYSYFVDDYIGGNGSDFYEGGSDPWISDDTDYIRSETGVTNWHGDFVFGRDNDTDPYENVFIDFNTTYNITLCIESSGNPDFNEVNPWIYNGTWTQLTPELSGAWDAFNVTDYFTNRTQLGWVKVRFQDTGGNTMTIYRCKLEISQFRGIGESVEFLYYPGVPTTTIYGSIAKFNSTFCAVAYFRYQYMGPRENVYFLYSNDKGFSWFLDDGTAKTLPIHAHDGLIVTMAERAEVMAPILDEQGIPTVAVYVSRDGLDWTEICAYSATLGNAGSWNTSRIYLENGTHLFGSGAAIVNDAYYGNRTTLWKACNGTNYQVAKYVRYPETDHRFRCIYVDDDVDYVSMVSGSLSVGLIQEGIEAYELVVNEYYTNALSNLSMGDTWQVLGEDTLWGVKVYATMNTTLNAGNLYSMINDTTWDWKCGIYNSSLHLLAESAELSNFGSVDWVNWVGSASYPSPPEIIEDDMYYFVFRFQEGQNVSFTYTSVSDDDMCFTIAQSWSIDLPSEISVGSITNYSYAVTCMNSPVYLKLRGIGVKPPTELEQGWNSFYAWGRDVDKDFGEVNASLIADGIDWTHFTLIWVGNSSERTFVYGYSWSTTCTVENQYDVFWIWVNDEEPVFWEHIYP